MARFVGRNSKRSFLAIIWDDLIQLDTFTKTFLLVAILFVIVTPYIANNYQTFFGHASSTTSTTYSIVLNQSAPHFGDSVNFTGVYPKEATIKAGRQQMNNPAIQVDCYQNGVRIFTMNQATVSSTNNQDGTITGVFGQVTLSGGGNGFSWTGGAANCYTTLYYFSRLKGTQSLQYNFLAQTTFDVAQ